VTAPAAEDYTARLAAVLTKLKAQLTLIAWCHMTFNPWRGCVKIDAECRNCYASTMANRWGWPIWGMNAVRAIASEAYWRRPARWNRLAGDAGVRLRVFCASLADVFELRPDPTLNAGLDAARARLFRLIEATPHLDWLLLTKRPEHIRSMAPARWWTDGWPPNVWIGTSIGRQHGPGGYGGADTRVPELLALRQPDGRGPRVLFLSCEPLIGPVDLTPWLYGQVHADTTRGTGGVGGQMLTADRPPLDWVIIGGESGAKARRMDPAWARALVDQCTEAGVPVFFKQAGVRLARELGLTHPKGEDPAEWPEEWMQVQNFPEAA
jgi:protein gp37